MKSQQYNSAASGGANLNARRVSNNAGAGVPTHIVNLGAPSGTTTTNTAPRRVSTQTKQKVAQLKQELLQIRYKGHVSTEKALQGQASIYLPVVHYTLLIYSRPVADFIQESGFDLFAQNDYSFMKNVMTMLSKLFEYSPPFKLEDFFAPNVAVDRKVSFVLTLITMVKSRHAQLGRSNSKSKPKMVTFRKDDSVALPDHPTGSPSDTDSKTQRLSLVRKNTFEEPARRQLLGDERSGIHQPQASVQQQPGQGILINHGQIPVDQQRTPSNKSYKTQPVAQSTATTTFRPMSAQPISTTTSNQQQRSASQQSSQKQFSSGILRAPSSSSEQSRRGTTDTKPSDRQRENSAQSNNYYTTNAPTSHFNQNKLSLPPKRTIELSNEATKPADQSSTSSSRPISSSRQQYMAMTNTISNAQPPPSEQDNISVHSGMPVQPQNLSLNQSQIDKLSAQNQEFATVIGTLHKTIKSLSSQFDAMQSSYAKQFQVLTNQNANLQQRVTHNELKLKKYKQKWKGLAGEVNQNNPYQIGGTAARQGAYNAIGSNQVDHRTSTRSRSQQVDKEKGSVMAAHQITFNQHIVMDSRQGGPGANGAAAPRGMSNASEPMNETLPQVPANVVSNSMTFHPDANSSAAAGSNSLIGKDRDHLSQRAIADIKTPSNQQRTRQGQGLGLGLGEYMTEKPTSRKHPHQMHQDHASSGAGSRAPSNDTIQMPYSSRREKRQHQPYAATGNQNYPLLSMQSRYQAK